MACIPYFMAIMLFYVLQGMTTIALAKSVVPPDDPAQSIAYWKPHIVLADKDPLVANTQAVFTVLLRAWDSSRLEPNLYVVNSSAGAWAASLADGNILMSRDAIKTCINFGGDRADHLLAFVLAHELAHQRSDDLWHQRFFRLVENHSVEDRQKMLGGLELDNTYLATLAQKEAQADHDSLIMMSSVGYDPYSVLDKNGFFTAWVENIWKNSCSLTRVGSANYQACKQAQSRALRARAQLTTVATQSMLYELGVQAFTANQFQKARHYFTAYGRDYSSRVILSALGLSYFAEALAWQRQSGQIQNVKAPVFYYPLLLDASASAAPSGKMPDNASKRAALVSVEARNRKKIHANLEQSIHHFEKAIRLEPDHAKTYLLLAFSYLLDGNTFMARGVVQGKYIPKFNNDTASELVLAMTSALEGKRQQASKSFERVIEQLEINNKNQSIPSDILTYSAYYNSAAYATYLGQKNKAEALWKQLASKAKKQGNSLLFRLALNKISGNIEQLAQLHDAPNINGMRLGDRFVVNKMTAQPHLITDLWIEGELHHVYRFENGSRYIIGPEQRIISAWQAMGNTRLKGGLKIGDKADRPLKSLGIPSRRLSMMSGEYLAYDNYGLAIHIVQDRVAGWFLYE
jgi:tetratricopeptide (TPR) repeat protein